MDPVFSSMFSQVEFETPPAQDTLLLDLNTSHSVMDTFKLRQQLYENRAVFHDECAVPVESASNGALPEETAELCDRLDGAITQGRDLLSAKLQAYMRLRDAIADVQQQREAVDAAFRGIKAAMLQFERVCLKHHGDRTAVLTALDESLSAANTIREESVAALTLNLPRMEDEAREAGLVLKRLSSAYRVLRSTNMMFTCPICLDRPVDRFIIPCGHTYCSECLRGAPHSCALCRQNILQICDLFFC